MNLQLPEWLPRSNTVNLLANLKGNQGDLMAVSREMDAVPSPACSPWADSWMDTLPSSPIKPACTGCMVQTMPAYRPYGHAKRCSNCRR